jgi:hypothetical protein
MARKKRRGFGEVARDTYKVSRASVRGTANRTLGVTVKLGRTSQGIYTALACTSSRTKVHGAPSWKAEHCGQFTTGATPTKAAGKALTNLGAALARIPVRK